MSRIFQWINLAGVCILAACCAVQWQANRQLHLRQINLEGTRLQQTKALADRDQTIQGNMADMNAFRDRLTQSDAALKEAQATIKADDARLTVLAAQRDQLQSTSDALEKSLDQWKAAVTARDTALAQAADQATKLIADRNDAITQFNQVATRYNAAQDQLKQAADQMKKLAVDRNDAVAKFNELADKYNAIVQQLNASATKP